MEVIDANGREMVLVRNASGGIVGLITDGDIRRGLLAGLTLDSPVAKVMTGDFFTVSPEVDRASVLDVMKARLFQHVPVLDRERRLIGVHFLRDLIGASAKATSRSSSAGGQGMRLRR